MIGFLNSTIFDNLRFEGVDTAAAGTAIMIVLLLAMVLIAVGVNVVPRLAHRWEIEYTTRDLTYGAVCLAMAYALSWIKLFEMPLGGTVTLASLLPIYIYCYYFGFRKGTVISAAFMLLQFTQGVYVVSPWSAFFDYILPYFARCVVGLFSYKPDRYAAFLKRNKDNGSGCKKWAFAFVGHWRILVGAILHMVIRYASQVFSGVLCWDWWGYAPAALSYKLTFSLGYNAFGLVDTAIAVVASMLLMSSLAFNRFMTASFAVKTKGVAEVSATEAVATENLVETATATETEAAGEKVSDKTE